MPFQKGDAEFITLTVWGTALSFTPGPTKAKIPEGARKARRKTWEKAKTIIRGKPLEDRMSIVESQGSRESNTETEEETEVPPTLPPTAPSNLETGSTSNATGDNASRYETAEDHTDKRDGV